MVYDAISSNVQLGQNVSNWEDAIKLCAKPLLEKGLIEDTYVQGMVNSVNVNGPYIVIMPGIAMPHTTSQGDVHQTCMSFTQFEKPVIFPGGVEANIFLCLAAKDADGHMDLISELAGYLMQDNMLEKLSSVKQQEELKHIFN